MNWPELSLLLAWPAALWLPALPFWDSWRLLADRLAAKVNKGGPRQQRLAGALALLLLWGSLLALALVLSLSADLPLVIEGLAFYLALSDGRPAKLKAMESLGKVQGRQLLGTLLKRDCSAYTPEGLAKAAVEGRWRYTKERLLLVLLLLPSAGLVALLLRAWWQLAERWHPARPGFWEFGRAALGPARLCRALGLVPALFWLVLPLKPNALLTREKPRQLAMLAWALGCQLGGPLRLQGRRLQRPRVGPATAPSSASLRRFRHLALSAELGTLLLIGLWLALS